MMPVAATYAPRPSRSGGGPPHGTRPLVPLAAVLLVLVLAACGSAGAGSSDGDDGAVRYFGHEASVSDREAITTLVQHYYAAVAARDGVRACSLIHYILAESVPEDYGRPPGPLYLRGVTSCGALLSLVFKRFHAQLEKPPRVTGVRVNGSGRLAYALLDWRTLPAGYMEARREGGRWKINRVLAAPMP
jgi:hypothetical protein